MLSYPTPLETRVIANMSDDALLRALDTAEDAWFSDVNNTTKYRTAMVFLSEAQRRGLA